MYKIILYLFRGRLHWINYVGHLAKIPVNVPFNEMKTE